MQRVLEPIVRQALGMTMAGLKQNNGVSVCLYFCLYNSVECNVDILTLLLI
jgi:hypothetical protein